MLSRQRNAYSGSPGIQSELVEFVSHSLCRNAHPVPFLNSLFKDVALWNRWRPDWINKKRPWRRVVVLSRSQQCLCKGSLWVRWRFHIRDITLCDTLRILATRRCKTPDSNIPTPRFISSWLKRFSNCLQGILRDQGSNYKSKSNLWCVFKVLSLKSIFWKFEAFIFKIDEYMEVWISVCNKALNTTSRNMLSLIWCQNAGLQLLVDYSRLGITIS